MALKKMNLGKNLVAIYDIESANEGNNARVGVVIDTKEKQVVYTLCRSASVTGHAGTDSNVREKNAQKNFPTYFDGGVIFYQLPMKSQSFVDIAMDIPDAVKDAMNNLGSAEDIQKELSSIPIGAATRVTANNPARYYPSAAR